LLRDNRWEPLSSARLLSDTTNGFLRTGIIRLDLPAAMTSDNSIVPGGLYWIKVATDLPSGCFAGLTAITAQAVTVRRTAGLAAAEPLLPEVINTRSATIVGVKAIAQPHRSIGLRLAETPQQMHIRLSERLRHKQRAETPWDIERLVLERFPQVYKVRCLPATGLGSAASVPGMSPAGQPGSLLVVVVPALPNNLRETPAYRTRPMRIADDEIAEIAAMLKSVMSPLASATVIPATFEWVQVRCQVALARARGRGEALRRINDALVGQLSPWVTDGPRMQFDWRLRAADIAFALRSHDDVRAVHGLSLLRVWEDDRPDRTHLYRFDDSALGADGAEIRALRPWSLHLPVDQHMIEPVTGRSSEDGGALPTGLAPRLELSLPEDGMGLEIAETFVIGRGDD
ncbi:MAG: hypothetical protein RL490_1976, partial [Pseudomonadota bacterium]